jgi:hypothetical protein
LIFLKKQIFSIVAMSFVLSGTGAFAVTKKHAPKSKLSTNVNFEDLLVDGKYQYPSEATTTVENEKDLDDLIGARKHFRDRLGRSMDRR